MSDNFPISTPMSITGDVAPVALFSPEPPSSTQVAVGLAEVASLGASLPAADSTTMQRLPPFGDNSVSINVDSKYLILSEMATIDEVRVWVEQVKSPTFKFLNHMDYITSVGKLWIRNKFEASSAIMHDGSGSTNWESFNVDQFCVALLGVMSDVSTGNARAMSYPERIKGFRLEFCIEFVKTEDANFIALRQVDNNNGNKADQKECYNLLVKKLTDRFKEQYRSPPLLHGDTIFHFTM